jgi:hypothetical protein
MPVNAPGFNGGDRTSDIITCGANRVDESIEVNWLNP